MYRPAIMTGALFAALAVILGAFGAHALKEVLAPGQLNTFETAVKYQFYHSFALLACGAVYGYFHNKNIRLATLFFVLGIILFSGSLYTLVIMDLNEVVGLKGLGLITPVGGLFFVAGWLMLLLATFRKA